jgi:hypothetical protein
LRAGRLGAGTRPPGLPFAAVAILDALTGLTTFTADLLMAARALSSTLAAGLRALEASAVRSLALAGLVLTVTPRS